MRKLLVFITVTGLTLICFFSALVGGHVAKGSAATFGNSIVTPGNATTRKCANFTSSGSWTAPVDVSVVDVLAWGGGGGGGAGSVGSTYTTGGAGGGGGGGAPAAIPSLQSGLSVTSGGTCTVTIGAGGTGGMGTDGGLATTLTASMTWPANGFSANVSATVANALAIVPGESLIIPGYGFGITNGILTPTTFLWEPGDQTAYGNVAQNTVVDAGTAINHLQVPATVGGDTILTCGSNVYTWAGGGIGGIPFAGFQAAAQAGGIGGSASRLMANDTAYVTNWGGGSAGPGITGAGQSGTAGGAGHTAGAAPYTQSSIAGYPGHDWPRFWAGDGAAPAFPTYPSQSTAPNPGGGGGGAGGVGGMNPSSGAFVICTPGSGGNGVDGGAEAGLSGSPASSYSNTNSGQGGCGGGGGGGAPTGIKAGYGGNGGNGDNGKMTICYMTAH